MSGDTVIATTRDSRGFDLSGEPMPAHLKPEREDTALLEANPNVGPIYVEDAEQGDALAVEILRIQLNRPSAFSAVSPNFGSMGVAPRFGRVETTLAPGEYGGNMDCVETKEGTTVYFPVWVRGAYLGFGDVHAAQGDGEICGSGLETTAEVTLRLTVRKGWTIEWPRLEDGVHIMVAASARPLYDAFAIAHVELNRWLVEGYGFDRYEAFQVLSQAGTARVGNVVDPFYTVVAKFPKACLEGGA